MSFKENLQMSLRIAKIAHERELEMTANVHGCSLLDREGNMPMFSRKRNKAQKQLDRQNEELNDSDRDWEQKTPRFPWKW